LTITNLFEPKHLTWLIVAVLPLSLVTLIACAQLKSASPSNEWGYKVVASYPHDEAAFTQGLEIVEGQMYESIGGDGTSALRRVDWKTGDVQEETRLKYFAEGITILGDQLFQLTWKNRVGLIYDLKTLKYLKAFSYTGEGWGLTNDGTHLIMSDGTSTLRYLDPIDFRVVKRLAVKAGKQKIGLLNELEYVEGEIWSNIWYDERIVRISPIDGSVLGWINLTGLFPRQPQDRERVLNGIAYDRSTKKLFVTGKNWPELFEIQVVRR